MWSRLASHFSEEEEEGQRNTTPRPTNSPTQRKEREMVRGTFPLIVGCAASPLPLLEQSCSVMAVCSTLASPSWAKSTWANGRVSPIGLGPIRVRPIRLGPIFRGPKMLATSSWANLTQAKVVCVVWCVCVCLSVCVSLLLFVFRPLSGTLGRAPKIDFPQQKKGVQNQTSVGPLFSPVFRSSVPLLCSSFFLFLSFSFCSFLHFLFLLFFLPLRWAALRPSAAQNVVFFSSFPPSSRKCRSFFSLWGLLRGIVAAGQGHGPPKLHVWACVESRCASQRSEQTLVWSWRRAVPGRAVQANEKNKKKHWTNKNVENNTKTSEKEK